MKKTSLSIALFICVLLQINASPITIKESKVMDVTVYRNYAKETRVGSSKIPAGNSEIIISNITYAIDENSIQVGSKGGNIKILSVSTRINYLTEPNKDANPTKVIIWQDSIKLLQNKMGFCSKKIEVYETGLSILNNNNKLGTAEESLLPEMLKQLVELNLSKQLELKKLIFENYLEYSEINQEISVLQTQIYQGSSVGTSKAIREVVLKINAKEAETAQFKVSYITTAAY
ncbi:MAG: DUF4140 domain-containing protein [Bacteroidetes bacterium]|nr:DUF4140 domain-containing protein [Bacteroidota bacterium]